MDEEENLEPIYNEQPDSNETSAQFYDNQEDTSNETIKKVTGMYKDWFLEYASYVILERAVPAIEDGFKPVQRRIMHSIKELDDGRMKKVVKIFMILTLLVTL